MGTSVDRERGELEGAASEGIRHEDEAGRRNAAQRRNVFDQGVHAGEPSSLVLRGQYPVQKRWCSGHRRRLDYALSRAAAQPLFLSNR
jgi:hypothetical protein